MHEIVVGSFFTLPLEDDHYAPFWPFASAKKQDCATGGPEGEEGLNGDLVLLHPSVVHPSLLDRYAAAPQRPVVWIPGFGLNSTVWSWANLHYPYGLDFFMSLYPLRGIVSSIEYGREASGQ